MTHSISVVCFKWHAPGYRCKFDSTHVNTLRDMVARHYPDQHRFICVTDDPQGIADGIEKLRIWNDYANVPNPTGGGRPSCYRRLKLFAPDIGDFLGERIVWLDLDAVVCGDLRPLWNRPEDVVLWRNPQNLWPYNGAMGMLTAGARPRVWTDFDPKTSPALTESVGYRGSDQAWLSYRIPGEATWSAADGVYYIGVMPDGRRDVKPANARIVFFNGGNPPWESNHAWVRANYR